MNTEKLKEIGELIDMGKSYKKRIDGMADECKCIQQYCIDALQDLMDTFTAVCEILDTNPQIMHNKDEQSQRNQVGIIESKAPTFEYSCKMKKITSVRRNKYRVLDGLLREVRCQELTQEKIAQAQKRIKELGTDGSTIEGWLKRKELAEETRKMCETMLDAVRADAKWYADRMKYTIYIGMTEGAKKYERVA